jgi:predicted AAA+ superfamily ATPase
MEFFRYMFSDLLERMESRPSRIQVLIGPRQTGKTTLARQVAEKLAIPSQIASADAVGLAQATWIYENWEVARTLAKRSKQGALLILDEVQKINDWSEHVKKLWDDEVTEHSYKLSVMLLGSSPLLMQKGLTESLTGRFELVPVTHWSFAEMRNAFGFTLEQYIAFGGYPGGAEYVNNPQRWSNYILDSIVETTISRDVFLMARIDKPALFRQLFELGCHHSGHILSLQKVMGQLQDAGNATTLAGYLSLLEGAGLLAGLPKFSKGIIRKKASSPKFQVFNSALLTAWNPDAPSILKEDSESWGQLVESAVGAHLVNEARRTRAKVYYWNNGVHEVDFVVEIKGQLLAIEVKSGRQRRKVSGLKEFLKSYPSARPFIVGTGGINLEEFFTQPLLQLL